MENAPLKHEFTACNGILMLKVGDSALQTAVTNVIVCKINNSYLGLAQHLRMEVPPEVDPTFRVEFMRECKPVHIRIMTSVVPVQESDLLRLLREGLQTRVSVWVKQHDNPDPPDVYHY